MDLLTIDGLTQQINLGTTSVGALVIYGLVAELRKPLPEEIKAFSFILNLIIGIAFGFFHLFGVVGIEAGILASLISTGGNAFINKIKSTPSPTMPVGQ